MYRGDDSKRVCAGRQRRHMPRLMLDRRDRRCDTQTCRLVRHALSSEGPSFRPVRGTFLRLKFSPQRLLYLSTRSSTYSFNACAPCWNTLSSSGRLHPSLDASSQPRLPLQTACDPQVRHAPCTAVPAPLHA
jgi:hypothetical protein